MEYNIKDLLRQYIDLKMEYKDKQEAIERLEIYINKLEKEGYSEVDVVTGGEGGMRHFKIEGFPYPAYSAKKTQLLMRQLNLQEIQDKISEQIVMVEQYINLEEDSRIRRLLTYRYVEGLSWVQVAHRMGKYHTADSCRVTVNNFLKEK